MISPFVRRHRLAAELVALREENGYSAQKLATEVGVGRQSISRLENGHVSPDLSVIMKVLGLFSVGQQRWEKIMTIAREAQERGWWAKYADQMGARQARYADLEAGADHIREYQLTHLPGLLQIPPYTEARLHADRDAYPATFDPAKALEARAARQRMIERPGGPEYTVIIDEMALRRATAPVEVLRTQFDHLADVGHHRDNVTLQVLPVTASITGRIPSSAFFCYHYPDPDDPTVVAVDTITSDLMLIDTHRPDEVRRYIGLYDQLQQAALSPADSRDLLATLAEDLTRQIRR
jgi:transcriptional regulator with XRE-family HTH domain